MAGDTRKVAPRALRVTSARPGLSIRCLCPPSRAISSLVGEGKYFCPSPESWITHQVCAQHVELKTSDHLNEVPPLAAPGQSVRAQSQGGPPASRWAHKVAHLYQEQQLLRKGSQRRKQRATCRHSVGDTYFRSVRTDRLQEARIRGRGLFHHRKVPEAPLLPEKVSYWVRENTR